MYGTDDIGRSVGRYLIGWLGGAPWTLELERVEIRDDDRPAALVEVGQMRTRRARVSRDQGNVTEFAPLTVMLYPAVGEPRAAGRAARDLATSLKRLIDGGADDLDVDTPDFRQVNGRPAAGPERMPLWDYAAVPLESDADTEEERAAERAGPELAHDVMWVEDYGVNAVQDPQDARRWSVALDARVSWERPGRIPVEAQDAPVVVDLPGQFSGEVRPDAP